MYRIKQVLDGSAFFPILILTHIFLILLGFIAAMDDSHSSVVVLIIVVAFLFITDVLLCLLSLFVSCVTKYRYVGLLAFWVTILGLITLLSLFSGD